jgi:hypothetical protein
MLAMKHKLIAAALGASTLLLAPSVLAAERAVDEPGWSVAGLLGLGFTNFYGFGLGARGGYTLPNHVYLGGTLVYSFGWSGYGSFFTGFEGGYDIEAGPLIVRPYGGVGPIWVTFPGCIYTTQVVNGVVISNGCAGSGNYTAAYFAFWAGGTLMYPIQHWFVGGDLRFLITGYQASGALMGTGGYQF